MSTMFKTILLFFFVYPLYTRGQFVSPCPGLFTYDNIAADSWSGTLRVTLDTDLSGIWLKSVFDRPFDDLTTDFGEPVHREPNEYLIRRPTPKVNAGTTLTIRIKAPNNPVLGAPQLLGYRINGKTVCPTSGEIPPPPPVESLIPLSAGGGGLESPCPGLFTYEPLGADANRWYGNINVKSGSDLSGVWMRVVLDKPPVEFGTDFGEAEQKEPNEFLVKNPKHRLNTGDTLQFRVHADYIPGEAPPKLLGYRLNGVAVCPTNGIIAQPMADLPVSPCPSIFQYEPRGPEKDRWSGNINVASDVELSGVWIRIVFDKAITDLGTTYGESKRRGVDDFLVNKRQKLQIGERVQFQITPQFSPNEPAPKIMEIRLNGRTVCPENGAVESTTKSIAEQLISPCPELFTYEPPGPDTDRWYGNVNFVTDRELNGMWIRIILDRQSIQLGNWFGEVKTDDNTIYRIHRRDYKLSPGKVAPVRFFIKYNPAEPVPKLIEIKLNAVSICPAGNVIPTSGGFPTQNQVVPVPPSSVQQWLTTSRPVPKPDWGGAFKPPIATNSQCGEVVTQPVPLVYGGNVTEEGQWPWHAALYYTGGIKAEYYCGGVLISLNHVLTAAHCVASPGTSTPVNTNDVQAYLGKHLMVQSNRGVQIMQIRRVILQQGYDSNNYANDIALLHLSRPADYTDWVRPVCLWSENTDLNTVENREGTVVGWGYDSAGQVTDKLLKAVMPVVSHQKCIWSNKQFYKRVVNDRNFCAGFRNGTSVCTGDSGGGLVFPTAGSNSRWQIRGIVSLSVALQDSVSACDTSHYVVFTDVAKFLPWIQQAMNSG